MLKEIQPTLEALEKFGRKGIPLTRVYPKLYKRELYIGAYNKLYSNKGAMTEGIDPTDTIDGMNLGSIDRIIVKMRREQYRFKGTRKAEIPKAKGGFRIISVPTFSDKMVQECIRVLLESYYEPQFSVHSHGFRPNRGCHTALEEVKREFSGVKWFIEGDIKGCFDYIDHDILMDIIARNIKDGRLLGLIRKMLVKGAAKEWYDGRSYSGTPQGGVLTPPTMLQTAPFGAQIKRVRRHPEYDIDLFFADLDTFDQRPDEFTLGKPISFGQAIFDLHGELF